MALLRGLGTLKDEMALPMEMRGMIEVPLPLDSVDWIV